MKAKMGTGSFIELGLIGYPLGHSLSPRLHQAALAAAGIQGEYHLFPIAPDVDGELQIEALVERVRTGSILGLNVTIPHKQRVIKYIDQLAPVAAAVGAVNTLYLNKEGIIIGENTDVPGFMRDVSKIAPDRPGKVVVLGAGGSARAVVFGLCNAGWEVHVLARRIDQAVSLVDGIVKGQSFQGRAYPGCLSDETLHQIADGCTLLVNTTPVGMYPNSQASPWPTRIELPARAAVYDLIYNPLQTLLLQQARMADLPSLNGSGMLVAQAALAFGYWTGFEPPFAVMEQAFPARLPAD